jgi:hypothetical protein
MTPQRLFQRLFWETWVETFTTERMWRVWQLAHPVEWQGPIHPAHITDLLSILEDVRYEHSLSSTR